MFSVYVKDSNIKCDYAIFCDINESKIKSLLHFILINCCQMDVYGYNREKDEYWAKKIDNSSCILQFDLCIKSTGKNESVLLLTPFIGKNDKIKQIYKNIEDLISLYESSDFIRNTLDEQ